MEVWHIVILSLIAEIVEVLWQYSPTMIGVIDKIRRIYHKSIFLLLFAHVGYLYILYVSLRFDILNWPIVVAIAFKTLDIFTKIELVRKVYVNQEIDEATQEIMSVKLSPWLWLIGPLTYPYLIWLAVTQV